MCSHPLVTWVEDINTHVVAQVEQDSTFAIVIKLTECQKFALYDSITIVLAACNLLSCNHLLNIRTVSNNNNLGAI